MYFIPLFDLLISHLDHSQFTERDGKIRSPQKWDTLLGKTSGRELIDGVQGSIMHLATAHFVPQ